MDEGHHEGHNRQRLHKSVSLSTSKTHSNALTEAVVSSCNIPTIPLTVAQAMNPAPRPPSPAARDATQKALRRDNVNQLSTRDAQVLMGYPSGGDAKEERGRLNTVFADDDDVSVTTPSSTRPFAPPRPSREMRRGSIQQSLSSVRQLSVHCGLN